MHNGLVGVGADVLILLWLTLCLGTKYQGIIKYNVERFGESLVTLGYVLVQQDAKWCRPGTLLYDHNLPFVQVN